jgi:hypothetical protein
MDVSSDDHPVLSPSAPLARVDGCDVRDWDLGTKLDVVGTNQA